MRTLLSACCLSVVYANLLLSPSTADAQTESHAVEESSSIQMAARDRLESVLRILDEEDYAGIQSVVRNTFTPELAASASEEEWLTYIADQTRRSGGIVRGTVSQVGNETLGYFQSELTGRWGAVVVTVEPAAPYRIATLEISRARAPRTAPLVEPPSSERARWAGITSFAAGLERRGLFSGVIAIAREDQIVFERAFGLAERNFSVPNTIDTRFSLGSVDKSFTAIAIAQLVERGLLSYDDPLSKFMIYPDAESANRIQIRHLLTHTSGLGDYVGPNYWANVRTLHDVDSYMAILDHAPPAFEPGTDWAYSNLGFLLLGRIIEIVTGDDYYEYVQQNVFAPAGMSHSFQEYHDRPTRNVAIPYYDVFRDGQFLTMSGLATPSTARGAPDGATQSTAGDMVRFYAAFRSGRLVSPETYRLMTTANPELGAPNWGYGFGVNKSEDAPRDIFGHAGDSTGGVCVDTANIRDLPTPFTVVVLSNGTYTCKAVFQYILSQYRTMPTEE